MPNSTSAPPRFLVSAQASVLRTMFALPAWARRLIAGQPVRIDGLELALDAQLLVRLRQLSGKGSLSAATPAEARKGMTLGTSMVCGPPIEPVIATAERIPVDGGTIDARLYTPSGLAAGSPILVYYHGGGWVIGDLDSCDNTCRFFAKYAGIRVLSVDYRLAPEHPFPTATEDALAAFQHAHANAERLGADPARIAIGGDSAGANLAAVTAHRTARAGGPAPVFQLLFYPCTDATVWRRSRELFGDGFLLTSDDMDWFANHYVPDVAQRADPRISVLLADDLSGMAPAYVATAGFDPLRDEGEELADRLEAAGVRVVRSRQEDLIHGYTQFLGLGARFREAMFEAVGALRTGLAVRETP